MTSPRQARSTPKGRFYTHPITGAQYASVTNVLGIIAKPALTNWAAKMVAEYAYDHQHLFLDESLDRGAVVDVLKGEAMRKRDSAGDVGDLVHAACEVYAQTGEITIGAADAVTAPFMEQFAQFLRDFAPEYLYVEATVYSQRFRYAWTLDAIVRFPELGLYVIDYKTSRGVYPEAALQLAALRHADELVIGDEDGGWEQVPMPETDGAAVLHLRPERYDLLPCDTSVETHEAFVFASMLAGYQRDSFSGLIGDPLTPLGAGAPEVLPDRPEPQAQQLVEQAPSTAASTAEEATLPAPALNVLTVLHDPTTPEERRLNVLARVEGYPEVLKDEARKSWRQAKLPSPRKDDGWTEALLDQAEEFCNTFDQSVRFTARGLRMQLAIRLRNNGIDTDEKRHTWVAENVPGRTGLSDCNADELTFLLDIAPKGGRT